MACRIAYIALIASISNYWANRFVGLGLFVWLIGSCYESLRKLRKGARRDSE